MDFHPNVQYFNTKQEAVLIRNILFIRKFVQIEADSVELIIDPLEITPLNRKNGLKTAFFYYGFYFWRAA